MRNSDWQKIKEVFHQVLDLSETEREIILASLSEFHRSEVSRLFESHQKLKDFISEPLLAEFALKKDSYIGTTIGSYKILSLLGSGGMGQVFLAEKEGLDKKFALKIIKRGMDTDAVLKRFVRERQILARLEHPNIANLLNAGTTDNDLPYFVMEYIEGEPITNYCNSQHLSIYQKLEIFRKVCEAVKYAHQNLIIHRDIKPSNILVTAEGNPKLLDFGVAKLLASEEHESTTTAMQPRMFTPEYASPEQINGLPITTTSDVYSLGVVLYELLSGVRPFNSVGKSYQEITNLVLTQQPIRPSSVVSAQMHVVRETNENKGLRTKIFGQISNSQSAIRSLKGDLDNIILKSLRKEPERRYQSVEELSEDIRRFLNGLPVSATADSSFYRFSKFVGRNRVWTAVALVVLLLLGISIWQGIIANRERMQANERFNQVRKLANVVLFDYQDGIKRLPGSTAIREKMINDGAEYLDNLAGKNPNDSELQLELAKAYDRLGDVKGNFFTPSFGNSVAAKEFYQKSMTIKQNLRLLNPNDFTFLDEIAVTHDKIADLEFGNGNQKEAVENYQKGVELREKIIQSDPNNQGVFHRLAQGYRNIGVRGRTTTNTDESLALCQKAIGMIEKLMQESPNNIEYQDSYTDAIAGIPTILETNPNRRVEAIEGYRKSIEMRRQLSINNPDNAVFRQKYAMSYSYLGDTFFELKKMPEAIENYKKCMEILDPMVLQDPQNEQLKQDHAAVYSSLAYTLALFGNTNESFAAYSSILKTLEAKYASDSSDTITHFRIGMAKEGLAITYENFAKLPKATNSEKISALRNALSNYEQTLTIYKLYQGGSEAAPTFNVDIDEAVAEVTEAYHKCAENLKKLKN